VNDIKLLLDIAVEAPRAATDPGDDLARARGAARRRTAHRLRVGTATCAMIAIAAVGAGIALAGEENAGDVSSTTVPAQKVQLVSGRFAADPYTFDLTPRGWHVQSQNAFRVTIAPDDGTTSEDPDDFRGKLVIVFDQNTLTGTRVAAGGREFWLTSDSDYTTISTPTRADEPPGVVRVQYPDNTGWSRAAMLAFLGSVHVGPEALPGLG